MSEHSVVAVFETVAQANQALRSLEQQGIPPESITVASRELESKQELHGFVSGSDQDTTFGLRGVLIGGAVGLIVGLAIMLLVRMTPLGEQFGWVIVVAGSVMIMAAGSIFGGLIGGMTGRGEKEARIEPYDEMLRAGKALLVAHGSHGEMTRAQSILEKAGALECKVHHRVTAPVDTTEAV